MFTWDEIYEIKVRKGCSVRCDVIRKKDQTVVAPNLKNYKVAEALAKRLTDDHRRVIEGWLLGGSDG
jgi:hypothetical protein